MPTVTAQHPLITPPSSRFDNAWWGGVLGHTYFNLVFGTLTTVAADGTVSHTLTASQQSAGTALGTAGIAIGCMIAGYVAKRFGRKKSFYAVSSPTRSR